MATNCSYYHGTSVSERFIRETSAVIRACDSHLRHAERVVDYGIGVGRITKAVLDAYPHIHVVGVDSSENMLAHAASYIPAHYQDNGRVDLLLPQSLPKIESGSVDFIFAIYVLQHVSSELVPGVLGQWKRILSDDGKLYVLNGKKRAVPRMEHMSTYRVLRKLFGWLDYCCGFKQGQRLSVKLDNKVILHDDGLDIEDKLKQHFKPERDIPLEGHPLLDQIMNKHFSRIYQKIH